MNKDNIEIDLNNKDIETSSFSGLFEGEKTKRSKAEEDAIKGVLKNNGYSTEKINELIKNSKLGIDTIKSLIKKGKDLNKPENIPASNDKKTDVEILGMSPLVFSLVSLGIGVASFFIVKKN